MYVNKVIILSFSLGLFLSYVDAVKSEIKCIIFIIHTLIVHNINTYILVNL